MGVLFFAYGLGTFIFSIGAIGPGSEGALYAGQYMILGVLLTGSGIYINNKRGWASGYTLLMWLDVRDSNSNSKA